MVQTASFQAPDKFAQVSKRRVVSGQVALTTTGDKFIFTPAAPCYITRWGVIADALIDVGAGMILAGDHRIDAGTDTGRVNGSVSSGVDTAGGTLSTSTTDVPQGNGLYHTLSSPFLVVPGEQFVIECTDAADTAGTGLLFIEYAEAAFQGDSGLTSRLTNPLYNMTSKAS